MLRLFTYGEVDEMRGGKVWWHAASKRYGEARYEAREYMVSRGEPDPEEDDIPDETIEDYCKKHQLMFDKKGGIWYVGDPYEMVSE